MQATRTQGTVMSLRRQAFQHSSVIFLPCALSSTSSSRRPSLFFPNSGPTDFRGVPRDLSGLLWANSRDADEASAVGARLSPRGSVLPAISQWESTLPPANTHNARVTAVTLGQRLSQDPPLESRAARSHQGGPPRPQEGPAAGPSVLVGTRETTTCLSG